MLLARTDRDVPKHQGLSFFIIDVGQPGIEVRPLHQMNGQHGFNEVFFTDAHIDEDRLVGETGGGWSIAVTVLMYERFSTALPSVLPGAKAGNLDGTAGEAAARAAQARTTAAPGSASWSSTWPPSSARSATRSCASGWPRCGRRRRRTAT